MQKQISLGIDPMTGKRIRKRVYGDTPAALKKAEKEAIQEFTRKGNLKNYTFEQYMQRWFDVYCSNLALNTQKAYKTILRKCSGIYYARMQDITRTDLQELINENWSHPDICRRMSVLLNAIWRSAEIDGVVYKNIATALKRPKTHRKPTRALTVQELDAIHSAPFTALETLLITLLLQFGLRPSEAFALDRTSINRTDKTLTINKSLTHDGERPVIKGTKTGVTRILPIPDEILPKLTPVNPSFFLFTNQDGQLFTKKQVYNFSQGILHKINKQMGGTARLKATDMVLYNFRHHRASVLYYTQGISTKAKAAYMGHSEEMFIKTYSHMIAERENMDALKEVVR